MVWLYVWTFMTQKANNVGLRLVFVRRYMVVMALGN